MVDLSGADAVRQDGELGPCRPFHGDRSDRRPPTGVGLTDLDRNGDLFVWLTEDERAEHLDEVLGRLRPEHRRAVEEILVD